MNTEPIYFWKDEHGWWWGDPECVSTAIGPRPTFEDCLDDFYRS
jgi:hypothetical protein